MQNIQCLPKIIIRNGLNFHLSKVGTREEITRFSHDIIDFNRDQKITCGKNWRTVYKYRTIKIGEFFAFYTC